MKKMSPTDRIKYIHDLRERYKDAYDYHMSKLIEYENKMELHTSLNPLSLYRIARCEYHAKKAIKYTTKLTKNLL